MTALTREELSWIRNYVGDLGKIRSPNLTREERFSLVLTPWDQDRIHKLNLIYRRLAEAITPEIVKEPFMKTDARAAALPDDAVGRHLRLSTAHLSIETIELLDRTAWEKWPVSGNAKDQGFYIYAHEDNDGEIPPDLWTCCWFAHRAGCDLIDFDAGYSTIPDLPEYDHGKRRDVGPIPNVIATLREAANELCSSSPPPDLQAVNRSLQAALAMLEDVQ